MTSAALDRPRSPRATSPAGRPEPQRQEPTAAPAPSSASARREPLPARLRELDGIRGIACVVVLLHHTLLTTDALAAIGARPGATPSGLFAWLMTRTPLHLLWAGYEAVIVFFVLSGVSLSYSVARRRRLGRRTSWAAYYPGRVIRLGVPATFATLATACSIVLIPRTALSSASSWVQGHASSLAPSAVWADLLLQRDAKYLDSTIWTLREEMAFSLALPLVLLVVWAARRMRLSPVLVLALLWETRQSTATGFLYLTVFGLGAIIGWAWGSGAVIRLPGAASRRVAVAALLLMCLPWYLDPADAGTRWWALALVTACAAALIIVLVQGGAFRRLLVSAPVQWLGGISFALYLVHDPVIMAVQALTATRSEAWTLFLAPPLALLVAIIVRAAVERPAHRLARAAGSRAESMVDAAVAEVRRRAGLPSEAVTRVASGTGYRLSTAVRHSRPARCRVEWDSAYSDRTGASAR